MTGPYTRVVHGNPGNDSSSTDATVVINAIEAGLEAVESVGYGAADHGGLIAMSFDPAVGVGSSTALSSAGTVFLTRLKLTQAATVTNVVTYITSGGSVLTSGQCFAALYQNGSLLAQTGDQSSAWLSSGLKTMALTSSQAVTAGFVDVAMWFNGTTGPAPYRGSGLAAVNLGLSAAQARYATANTGVTTTAPATLTGRTAASVAYWAAIS